jgi:hypothetical protein
VCGQEQNKAVSARIQGQKKAGRKHAKQLRKEKRIMAVVEKKLMPQEENS